jgi:hydrogenase maturation protease
LSERRINVIGVGNTLMCDDGAGPAAIEALRGRSLPPHVDLYDAGLAASDVLTMLDPRDRLIVIDAVRAGGEPGAVYRAGAGEFETQACAFSLHEVSVMPALAMEAVCGREFRDVTIFGVEPGTVGWGEGLSAEVTAGVDRIVEAILEEAGVACSLAAAESGNQENRDNERN